MLLEFARPEDQGSLSPENRALVEKVRRALALVNFTCRWQGFTYYAGCMVFANLSGDGTGNLDFRAYRPGSPAQAFIGPQISLSKDIFEGERLKPSHIEAIEKSFGAFREHMAQAD